MEETLLSTNGDPGARTEAKNGIVQTALLIIANLAGAGILSLPKAINGTGLAAGTVLVVISALLCGYTADILGECFDIIKHSAADQASLRAEQKDSFFVRSPYACIGQKASGAKAAVAVTAAQFITQFLVMVVFFLLSGINLNKLGGGTPLLFSLVCTALLTPLMLLRPGHVWFTAVAAIVASSILVVVIIILCATDAPHDPYTPTPEVTFSTFGTSFGVILFGYGGHAILPALQATMSNPTPARFRMAIFWSFVVVTVFYLGTAISAVLRLGGTVGGDVLTNFNGWINTFGLVSVTAHLLFAAVTVHIPVGQMLDHYFGASDLSARQIMIRLGTMLLVALVIWAAGDHFFCVLGLVGGTCSNAMVLFFPPWFRLGLAHSNERTPAMIIKMVAIMTVGVVGGISSLIGAVDSCRGTDISTIAPSQIPTLPPTNGTIAV